MQGKYQRRSIHTMVLPTEYSRESDLPTCFSSLEWELLGASNLDKSVNIVNSTVYQLLSRTNGSDALYHPTKRITQLYQKAVTLLVSEGQSSSLNRRSVSCALAFLHWPTPLTSSDLDEVPVSMTGLLKRNSFCHHLKHVAFSTAK